ncbi:hypothetical protein [Desulfotalea psychrophila]|uniref:hypothetical protein n=1 Tax=Desulfotalea psychrophila TaxID=84980 RepID=UPI00031EEC00|nr:hypothetical protein [Desulfotalea psychrophila]
MRLLYQQILLCIAIMSLSVSLVYGDSSGSFPQPGSDPIQIVYADIARQVVMEMPDDPVYQILWVILLSMTRVTS